MEDKKEKSTALAFPDADARRLNLPTMADVKNYLCPKASDAEIFFFLTTCKVTGLNPFKSEIYLVPFYDQETQKYKCVTMVSYLIPLKKAQATQHWGGLKADVIKDKDGKIKGAFCDVYRKDWKEPFHWEVDWDEVAKVKDGKPMGLWKKQPKFQIKKVCIKQAISMVFPEVTGDLPPVTTSEVPNQDDVEVMNGDAEVVDKEEIKPEKEVRTDQLTAEEKSETEKKPRPEFTWSLFWETSHAHGYDSMDIHKYAKEKYGIQTSLTELSEEKLWEIFDQIEQDVIPKKGS